MDGHLRKAAAAAWRTRGTTRLPLNVCHCLILNLRHLAPLLIAPHTSVCMYMLDPASSPKAEELGEETQPGEFQTEVGRGDYTVRHFLFSLAPDLAILTYYERD